MEITEGMSHIICYNMRDRGWSNLCGFLVGAVGCHGQAWLRGSSRSVSCHPAAYFEQNGTGQGVCGTYQSAIAGAGVAGRHLVRHRGDQVTPSDDAPAITLSCRSCWQAFVRRARLLWSCSSSRPLSPVLSPFAAVVPLDCLACEAAASCCVCVGPQAISQVA